MKTTPQLTSLLVEEDGGLLLEGGLGGFDGFNGGGMAPLMPTTSAQPANHMTPKPAMTSQPVFSSQPSNLMFGVQPMSLSQNNQRQNNSNPFNF